MTRTDQSEQYEARIDDQAEMLGNRLRKNARKLKKYLRREGISCYRVYDADIPEIPLVVDRYGDALHIAVYVRRSNPTGAVLERWLERLCAAAGAALDVPEEAIFLKRRERQRGTTQYERVDRAYARREVEEDGLRFIVNLSDYVDTGLFLDHRPTRARVRREARGRRVLNLFAYTGSFTVYAAAGGAASTMTVDLSKTYLDWAQENLALNDLQAGQHEFVHANVERFLGNTDGYWDLAVVDPPTFSNSKRMIDVFDVQRDHAGLLDAVWRRMAPGGIVYFSTNFRRFKLDPAWSSRLVEISDTTVPPDFRNRRIHRCFRAEVP